MTYEHLSARLVNALLDYGRASLRSLAEDLDVSVYFLDGIFAKIRS